MSKEQNLDSLELELDRLTEAYSTMDEHPDKVVRSVAKEEIRQRIRGVRVEIKNAKKLV